MINYDLVDPLLGTDTDKRVGYLTGLAANTVWQRRKDLGIPRYCKFPADKVALLGTMSDAALGALVGLSGSQVEHARTARKIPAFHLRIDWAPWDPLLGTMSDQKLAVSIGCDPSAVGHRRAVLGIPAWEAPDRTTKFDHLLGTMQDSALAQMFDVAPHVVRYRRKSLGIALKCNVNWEMHRPVLSSMRTNEDIAFMLGVCAATVGRARLRMGLSVAVRANLCRDWSDIDSVIEILDAQELARRFNLSLADIAWRRKNLGIKNA